FLFADKRRYPQLIWGCVFRPDRRSRASGGRCYDPRILNMAGRRERRMTFTIVARCQRTGMLGIGTATNAFCVGVRVPFIRERLGAVAIMAIADERLGPTALRLLELGYKAPGVIEQLVAADPFAEYRQLAVVDDDGFAAARTGVENKDWAGHRVGDGYVVLGNAIASEQVIDA